jgi:hypothetical protein
MRWSVSVVAEGDRVIELAEVVELADAVAAHGGIASGMGTPSYGAQIVVEADDGEQAVERAVEVFTAAAEKAGLPSWPITRAETIREDEAADYVWEEPPGAGPGEDDAR